MEKVTQKEPNSGVINRRKASSIGLFQRNNQFQKENNNRSKSSEHLQECPSKFIEDRPRRNKSQCEPIKLRQQRVQEEIKRKSLTASRNLLRKNKNLILYELESDEQPDK